MSILGASCTKEVKYSKEQLYSLALEKDSTVELVLPNNINEGVSCSDYSEGCLAGHTIKVQNLEFIAVEFQTEAQAIYAAKKFRGYYIGNWLLDDVVGEPVLERFASEKLQAKRP